MIRVSIVPHYSEKSAPGYEGVKPTLVCPERIISIAAPSFACREEHPGAQAVITTTAPDCEGIIVQETAQEVAMLRAGWFNQHKIADTANAHELTLYVYLDGAFVKPEKVMAR